MLVLRGYNCTIFAYGQTGAGKTYTMQGNGLEAGGDEVSRGLQPRVLDYLFHKMRLSVVEGTEVLAKCSYYEIYNEQVIDLLNPSAGTLQLREDIKTGAFLEGLTEDCIRTSREAVEVLLKGARNRHVSSTDMNFQSSRSHTVFALTIEQKRNKQGVTNVTTSKINFVDLAGSERQKMTNSTGERLKEAGNINKSLSTLGSVINSLVEISEGKKTHVRYRDSKLTFLLKDSLGGNARTAIIANVSPAADSFPETLSTLKFAQRAKLIRNNASINEETSGCIDGLKAEIARLRGLLAHEKETVKEHEKSQKKHQQAGMSIDQEVELIKECNTSRYDLERLLKESMEILSDTDKKLHHEYMKKDEFMTLFQKACSMYENKEHHMALMLRILQDKCARISKEEWSEQEETAAMRQTIQSLQSMTSDVPAIMQVFQENLQLKHQIVYANVDGKPNANMLKVMNLLRQNISLVEDVKGKIGQGMEQRGKLAHRFEKLCVWKGIPAEEINRISVEEENEELRRFNQTLNLELVELKQAEHECKTLLEQEQRRVAEVQVEAEKVRADCQSEIEGLEKRIEELNQTYSMAKDQGTVASTEYQLKEIQMQDQINGLTFKKTELLRKLDRMEERVMDAKKAQEQTVLDYEKKIGQLNLDVMRTQQELTMKKASNLKLKEEIDRTKAELEALEIMHKTDSMDKEKLKEEIKELEDSKRLLQEENERSGVGTEERLAQLIERNEELESERNAALADKLALREEQDTIQQSLAYIQSELLQKNSELSDKEKEVQRIQGLYNTVADAANTLQQELQTLHLPESSFNQAIRENSKLRGELLKLNKILDESEEFAILHHDNMDALQQQLADLSTSETHYKFAHKEAAQESLKKTQQLKEATGAIERLEKENLDLNSTFKQAQEDNGKLGNVLFRAKEAFEAKISENTDLQNRIKFFEKRVNDLKEEISSKVEQVHQANDQTSDAQLKYFTICEQFETLQEKNERDTGLLQSQLKAVNEQNKLLIQDRLDKEAEMKQTKSLLTADIANLITEVNEYRLTMASIAEGKQIDKLLVDNVRREVRENLQTDSTEVKKLSAEVASLKLEVIDKKKIILQLQARYDSIVKGLEKEAGAVNLNYARLDNQFKIAREAFKIKDEEVTSMKIELKNSALERRSMSEELGNLRFDVGIFTRKIDDFTVKNESLKKQCELLKVDNSLLCRMLEDPSGRQKVREEQVEKLKSEIEELRKDVLSKSRQKSASQIVSASKQPCEIADEEQVAAAFNNEDVKELVRNILMRISEHSIGKVKKVTKKSDVLTMLEVFEKQVDSFTQVSRAVKQQEIQTESKLLRYTILEKEIAMLRQRLNMYGGDSQLKAPQAATNGTLVINKRPQYVSKENAGPSHGSIADLRDAIMAYPIHKDTATPSANKNKTRVAKLEQSDLGKRSLIFAQDDEVNQNESPSLNKRRPPRSSTKITADDPSLIRKYVGILTDQNVDLDNYDNEASTPRKKLKS